MNETNTEKKCKLCGKSHPPREITLMGLIDSVLRDSAKLKVIRDAGYKILLVERKLLKKFELRFLQ